MAFNFASPLPLLCILGQLQFETVSFSQPRCVRWRRDKLRATQVEITFARPFRWQSKAMPEFKLSLEKIRAQPIDGRGAQLTCTDCFCARPCDCRTWAKHGLVITQHLRITDAGLHHRCPRSNMSKPSREVLQLPIEKRAEIAFKVAVAKAIDEHARLGLPIYIWRNSRVVKLSPNKRNESSRRGK